MSKMWYDKSNGQIATKYFEEETAYDDVIGKDAQDQQIAPTLGNS